MIRTPFVFSVLCPVLSFAAPEPKLAKLIEQAKKDDAACEAAYLRMEKAGEPLKLNQDDGTPWGADAARATKVADEMKKYPGASKAGLEATDIVGRRIESGGKADDISLLFELRGCRVIGYYKHGKALIESVPRL